MVTLFELITNLHLTPSAYCWRARLARIHKGCRFKPQYMKYSEISSIAGGSYKTLPVIKDEKTWVGGSGEIAEYLEASYPRYPTLQIPR